MATGKEVKTSKGEVLVVLPSVHLDSHMQRCAAEVIKARHAEEEGESSGSDYHDDDPMTPPDVLLMREIKHAEELAHVMVAITEMGVTRCCQAWELQKKEIEDIEVLKCWIRANALARIVHGQYHHILAKTHVQLGKTYLEILGLAKQALFHVNKGCDMLSGPSGYQFTEDGREEVWFQLGLGHCVAGQAHIVQGSLVMAEHRIQSAEKILRDHRMPHPSGAADSSLVSDSTCTSNGDDSLTVDSQAKHGWCYMLEKELSMANAKLDLKRGRFRSCSKNFARCIDLTRSIRGPQCPDLITLLRGLATAEANLSHFGRARESLTDAMSIAEELCGSECVAVAEIWQAQGRLSNAMLRAGETCDPADAKEAFLKAIKVLTTRLGSSHQKTLSCKEECCKFLSSWPETRENAVQMLEELIEEQKESLGEMSVEVGHSLKVLSSLFLEKGRLKEAVILLQEAKSVFICSLGPKHRETLAVTNLLKSLTLTTENPVHQSHWRV